MNENLGENFFDGHDEECNCMWCCEIQPAYSKLFKLLEENHFGWHNKEIKMLVDQIKEHHEYAQDTLETITDAMEMEDENLGDN